MQTQLYKLTRASKNTHTVDILLFKFFITKQAVFNWKGIIIISGILLHILGCLTASGIFSSLSVMCQTVPL